MLGSSDQGVGTIEMVPMRILILAIATLFPIVCLAQPTAPPDYRDRIIKVAVYDEAPFGFRDASGAYVGLMVEIWEDIAGELDLTFDYTTTDMRGLLAGLNSGRFDVGLGAITITPNRELLVDFSQPVNASGTGIVVTAQNAGKQLRAYIWPITRATILLAGSLITLLLVSGTIVWLVERQHPKDPGHRDIDTLEDGLWWSAVTMSTIGYGDKVPRTRLGRIVGTLWIFVALVLLSLFTANASAIFTVTEIESDIETNADLRRVSVGAARNSSGAEYLKRERIPFTEYENVTQTLDALLEDRIHCVVSNVPVVQYLNNAVYRRALIVSPKWLLRNNMGIAFKPKSALREPVDRVLLRLVAEPKWQSALSRYLGEEFAVQY